MMNKLLNFSIKGFTLMDKQFSRLRRGFGGQAFFKKLSRKKRVLTSQSGFTLIEILITVSIATTLIGAVFGLQYIIGQNQVEVWRNYLSIEEANNNISAMVKELRNTRSGDNAAYPLGRALDQEIIFYSDIDDDDQTERVRYTLAGAQLTKGVIEPVGIPATYPIANEKVKVVAVNVRNGSSPIFYYYNGDWPSDTVNNPLSTPARLTDTKLMRVYLELNPDSDSPEHNFKLESYVQIRMLKDNL